MAQRCDVCGKGTIYGNNVSHADNRSRRRWLPHLHKVRASVEGKPMRIKVCTGCLKSGKVLKAA